MLLKNFHSVLLLATIMLPMAVQAQIVGPEFTYQGQLEQNGAPANGLFDMEFRLLDAATFGTQIGSTLSLVGVEVSDGNFSVELDFGPDAFSGGQRWLAIAVNGTNLVPRQKITATPYSTYSSETRGLNVSSDGSYVGIGRANPFDSTNTFGIEIETPPGPTAFGGMYVHSTGGLSNAYYGYEAGTLFSGRHWIDGVFGGWNLTSTVTSTGDVTELIRVTPSGQFRAAPSADGSDINIFGGDIRLGAIGNFDYLFNLMDDGYLGIRRESPVIDGPTGQSWFDVTIPGNGDQIGAMYLDNENVGARTIFGYSNNGQSKASMTYDDTFNDWALNLGPNVVDEIYVNGNNSRVGLSTNSPTALLDVNGSARVRSNMDIDLSLEIGQNLNVFGNAFKPGGGFWSNLSDRRLKKNIRELGGSLKKLLSLQGVTYEYKDPKSINELAGVRTGFIAQDVEKIFPEWVDELPGGIKMLTVRGFEAITVEAIRELRNEKDEQIKELQTENEDLRHRLEALEFAVTELTTK